MSTLTINLDEHIKSKAQKKVKKEGLTLTALISRFLKEYLRGEWEFRISPAADKRMMETISQLKKDIASGKAKRYDDVDEMFEDMLSEPDELQSSID
ncbi:hypothetical protein KJ742_02980 [Patescibacteria group bacterium]|nr:hypothetical protein [Patescibacteria group bacterium]MBU1682885.1 hypothetical protein [Patescibacteria group bacterium]